MNRALMIARREYLAYAKTVGFWLSLLSFPLFAAVGGGAVYLMRASEPVRAVAVVEEGQGAAGLRDALQAQIDRGTRPAAAPTPVTVDAVRAQTEAAGSASAAAAAPVRRPRVRIVETPPALLNADPAARLAAARDLLGPDAPREDRLSAVVFLSADAEGPSARVWTRRAADDTVEDVVRAALVAANRRQVFAQAGIDPSVVAATEAYRPRVQAFSPRSVDEGGAVTMRDRLPMVIGLASGFLLWSLILTGASILLNSVMEEKSNKILEVLLSSASATEILAGKVGGVALVTLTMLAGWAVLGGAAMLIWLPQYAEMVWQAIASTGQLGFFLAYMVGGYLMYAVLFTAVGAFCETPRDAQTLMGPIMMVLIVPILVMQLALQTPDSPVVRVLSWIPFFTPFLMNVRIPAEPPLIEVIATMAGMFVFALVMVWIAGRAFRAGALSDAKLTWKTFANAVRGGA